VAFTINLFNALSQHLLREVRYLARYRRQATWKPSRHYHYNFAVQHNERTVLLDHYITLFLQKLFVYFYSISCQLNGKEYLLLLLTLHAGDGNMPHIPGR